MKKEEILTRLRLRPTSCTDKNDGGDNKGSGRGN